MAELMDGKYGRAKNLSPLILLDNVEKAIRTKVFRTKYSKRKHYNFSVHGHLHEHYCTFEQLVGKTPIKIESAVAKVTIC